MVVHSAAAAPTGPNVHSVGGGGGSGGGGGLESFTATNAGGGGPGSAMVINLPSGSAAGGRLGGGGGGSTRFHSGGSYREPVTAPIRMLSTDLIKTYKHINEVRSRAQCVLFFWLFSASQGFCPFQNASEKGVLMMHAHVRV